MRYSTLPIEREARQYDTSRLRLVVRTLMLRVSTYTHPIRRVTIRLARAKLTLPNVQIAAERRRAQGRSEGNPCPSVGGHCVRLDSCPEPGSDAPGNVGMRIETGVLTSSNPPGY